MVITMIQIYHKWYAKNKKGSLLFDNIRKNYKCTSTTNTMTKQTAKIDKCGSLNIWYPTLPHSPHPSFTNYHCKCMP